MKGKSYIMTDNLQNDDALNSKIEHMKELVSQLNRASEAYYGGNDEIMSNFEWDSFFDELSLLENETGIILDDSPTQNTSSSSSDNSAGNREAHEFPALSLAKTKSVEELKKWAEDRDIYLSYKLDGLTLVLTYDNGSLTKILTRGNGTEGTNITYLKDVLSGYPLSIKYKGHMVVRGEATISYTDFEEINALNDEDEKYANPRNLASGTLALDDPLMVKERHVCFNAFTLVHIDDDIKDWGKRMDFLNKEGFVTVEHTRCNANTIEEIIDVYTKKVEDKTMDIPVDGLVICYADNDYAKTGSVTGHHATRAGFAFKWADESAFSKLKYVEWSCAASTISPVAVFEPVKLEGTTVSRASLCNISEMERLNITDECTLEVIKANKIIPKCIAVKDSLGEGFTVPDKCPVCNEATVVKISPKSGTKTLHCVNKDCPAKQLKKFTRFVSKSGFDIDGLSLQTMLKFMNMGYIREFDDIFHLGNHIDEISKLEGFGEKSCENMMNAINKSKSVKAVNFIFAICIPLIGLDAAKKIVANMGFDSFITRLEENVGFEDVDGIGLEKSNKIIEWYKEEKNSLMLKRLLNEVQILDGEKKENTGGTCAGLTFVITGDVHHFKNRDEFKAYVEENGGKVTGSVSLKTNYLVNNDVESTSSKNKKAKDLGIPIISEDDFVSMFK